jgi:prepilin-type N-terminal cleavage/methylation domain-containing protein
MPMNLNSFASAVSQRLADESGFTLIELLVAMISATVLTMAAFAFLIFTNEDVSHITSRVAVDQNGRIAMQRIVSELHSACVAPNVNPVLEGSNETTLKFVSETGTQPTFATVHKHEIIFSESANTLTEKTYAGTGTAPNYTWSTSATTTKLLTNVKKTSYKGSKTPIFQYYRYYTSEDSVPSGYTTVPLGQINPTALTEVKSEKESEEIVKVTVAFTVAPEGKEGVSFNGDRPVPLEDSAIFRLAPSSEEVQNLPCTENV